LRPFQKPVEKNDLLEKKMGEHYINMAANAELKKLLQREVW
jgi:hypothetical protein